MQQELKVDGGSQGIKGISEVFQGWEQEDEEGRLVHAGNKTYVKRREQGHKMTMGLPKRCKSKP